MRILEEEGKCGTFTESCVKPIFGLTRTFSLLKTLRAMLRVNLFRVQKMDSKRDFYGDVGTRSATGGTLHPWNSRELHPDFELYLKSNFAWQG